MRVLELVMAPLKNEFPFPAFYRIVVIVEFVLDLFVVTKKLNFCLLGFLFFTLPTLNLPNAFADDLLMLLLFLYV
jgi:hypothetical protein